MNRRPAVTRFGSVRISCLVLRPLMSALLIAGLVSTAHSAPEGGVVRAGSAQIIDQGSKTLIQQSSQRAVIDWRGFGINSNEQVQFAQPSASATMLNRVTGSQVSMILGRLDANGQVLLINPNGIIFGKGAQVNVGSLIASTANLSNENFMQGKLIFDQPGKPGAGIVNSGSITAAEGGLIALVAPHVRNDGLIQARLGKVIMGATDTFTIDLYGDGLINLALSDESLAQLKDAQGQPVKSLITQAGTIDVGGGKAVLVTAEAAKGMLDSLINMSGTILADSAVQEGGRILLLAKGGNVDVSGHLSATGNTGGRIDVLGDQVHLAATAKLEADGAYGGGKLHVGGAFQGSGDTYRSQSTQIDAGAMLQASALSEGNGGEVIVWSDGSTAYAGSIRARGGAEGGDGGLVEVSGKQILDFTGQVDAGATYGKAGSLLLDPYNFTIGMTEASLINRVLRTGTSTSVSADNDIYVNYITDGRGYYAGGGLTLSAGNNINVNDYIITNNGAINLYAAAGMVNLAPGKVVYAGTAPITVRSGADLYMAPYLTGGLLSLISTQKSVFINQGIDASIGNLFIQAAEDVNINQPIVSHSDGNSVNIVAGSNINVDGQIDGRLVDGGYPYGSVTLRAGQNIYLNKSILANSINLFAGNTAGSLGTIIAPTMTAATVIENADGIPEVVINPATNLPYGGGLFAGTGPISVTSGGNLSSGIYVTTGPVSLRSTGGNVTVDTKLAEILGNVSIKADTGSVNVEQEIANIRSGSNLAIIAGTDINLNRQIDALDDTNPLSIIPVPGGSVTFLAGNNVNLNKDLATYNGAVDITATAGTLKIKWNNDENRTYRIQSGSAPITVITGEDLSTGNPVPPASTFPEIIVPEPPEFLELDPDDRFTAKMEWADNYIQTRAADLLKPYVAFSTTGKLSLTSTGGDVTVDAPIPNTTGEVAITAASTVTYDDKGMAVITGNNAIIVNHKVLSNNKPITLIAGTGGIKINSTDDRYGISFFRSTPSINPGSGDLTLNTTGNISMNYALSTFGGNEVFRNGILTKGILTLNAEGAILSGEVWCWLSDFPDKYPSKIFLNAGTGIGSNGNYFGANYSPSISATSKSGDIYLSVKHPGKLDITANTGSVFTGGNLGADTTIKAGTDITLSQVNLDKGYGEIRLIAKEDVSLDKMFYVKSLKVKAGGNVDFNVPGYQYLHADDPSIWFHGGNINVMAGYEIGNNWDVVTDQYNKPIPTASGGNITFHEGSAIHIGNPAGTYDYGLTLAASDSVKLRILQTLGPVTIKAQTGNITLLNDIGPPIPTFDPETSSGSNDHIGLKSLTLEAGGYIDMKGAKAAGMVDIDAGGILKATSGIFSGTPPIITAEGITSSISITAAGGAWLNGTPVPVLGTNPAVYTPYTFTNTPTNLAFGNIVLATQTPLFEPGAGLATYAPGPAVAPPGLPGALTALPVLPPGLASVAGYALPSDVGVPITPGPEQEVEANRLAANVQLSEIVPVEDEEEGEEENRKKILKISYGQGATQLAELGIR